MEVLSQNSVIVNPNMRRFGREFASKIPQVTEVTLSELLQEEDEDATGVDSLLASISVFIIFFPTKAFLDLNKIKHWSSFGDLNAAPIV